MSNRREIIAALGGTLAWPIAARAQQAAMPVIGYLETGSPEALMDRVAAFRKGLGETGYVEGQNVAIEFRWAQNEYRRLPELAADQVQRRVAVIAAPGSAQAPLAAKAATTTIPIVFSTGIDPVKSGLATSLNRPGGNATGVISMTGQLGPKQLGLLQELLPAAARFAVLANPNNAMTQFVIEDLRSAALTVGRDIDVFNAGSSRDIDTAFASLARRPVNALIVGDGGDVPQGSSDLFLARVCRGRRADELRNEPGRYVSPGRRLYRPDSQGGKPGRAADRAGNQV